MRCAKLHRPNLDRATTFSNHIVVEFYRSDCSTCYYDFVDHCMPLWAWVAESRQSVSYWESTECELLRVDSRRLRRARVNERASVPSTTACRTAVGVHSTWLPPAPDFKCFQLEIITQPKVIFVLFVSKLILEIIIALTTVAKQAAAIAAVVSVVVLLLQLLLRVSSGINYEATLYAVYNLLFSQ